MTRAATVLSGLQGRCICDPASLVLAAADLLLYPTTMFCVFELEDM